AYPREIPFETFREIADEHDAYFVVDIAHIAGLVAVDEHSSPFPEADVVTTTTHKTLRGARGGMILTNDAELSDEINKKIFPGIQGGPLMHIIAAKAVAFKEALQPEFKQYQQQIKRNAKRLGEVLDEKGYHVVSGGTDNHLLLVDLRPKGLTGKEAEEALDEVDITTNKNTVPGETESPFVTSGLRLGTPALTTRGMEEEEMEIVGNLIDKLLVNIDDESVYDEVQQEVHELTEQFPLYPFIKTTGYEAVGID
ncbi:MAG: serine hydroxymethyltransferase, partial [bacterium]